MKTNDDSQNSPFLKENPLTGHRLIDYHLVEKINIETPLDEFFFVNKKHFAVVLLLFLLVFFDLMFLIYYLFAYKSLSLLPIFIVPGNIKE